MAEKKDNIEAKNFAVAAAHLATGRHCTDVIVQDLRGKSPATDYFIIATGTSDRQIRSVADEIAELARNSGLARFGRAGYDQARWILLDYVDVVVHLFEGEYRQYYDLELLWGDAEKVAWEQIEPIYPDPPKSEEPDDAFGEDMAEPEQDMPEEPGEQA